MPFLPPLIKPPLPPLKPPPAPPFRIPPILREPPTQTDPQIDIPNKPPTEKDLLGIVCIYSNAPIYSPKTIRYRYPGGNWQEIAGDRFTVETIEPPGGDTIDNWILWRFEATHESWYNFGQGNIFHTGIFSRTGRFYFPGSNVTINGRITSIVAPTPFYSPNSFGWQEIPYTVNFVDPQGIARTRQFDSTAVSNPHGGAWWERKRGSVPSLVRWRRANAPNTPLPGTCRFRVFNASNQVILDITNSVCPEIEVIPEKCEYKQENEKLVRKAVVGIFQRLRVEYDDNCAKVLLDSPPLPFPTTLYEECSDENCSSPPRIRFDKKCEETCEQCPPGTVIKVLQGSSIACVDANGCILKRIEFKPGCNTYDCVCD